MENDGEVYENSLKNRKSELFLPYLEGESISVSPAKKRITYFDIKHLFVASPDGKNAKPVLDLPYDWSVDSIYKGMDRHSPLWSPDGKHLMIFDETRLMIIRIP